MAALAQNVPKSPRSLAWFREFLRQELAPYSGRFETVARMVIAATLVMIVSVTFRIPYAFEGAIYTFIISRESPRATLQSAGTTFLFIGMGAAYILLSVGFVISVPILHFLWVIGSFFLSFYTLSAMTNYGAASTFAVVRRSHLGSACVSRNERGRYALAHVGSIGRSRGCCGN